MGTKNSSEKALEKAFRDANSYCPNRQEHPAKRLLPPRRDFARDQSVSLWLIQSQIMYISRIHGRFNVWVVLSAQQRNQQPAH